MIKTQIQLPEHLYREAKRIAGEYEMSFADVVRRGLERVVPAFPPRGGAPGDWKLPVLDLGLELDPFADPDWRADLVVEPSFVHEPKPATRPRSRKGGRR
jgi:hypothetical protein